MYKPIPDAEVAAFRKWLYSTPVRDLPKPSAPTHAFDSAAPWMAFDRALKRRGISSEKFWSEYGKRIGRRALAKQALDEEQANKKFEQEQYAGEDDDHPYTLAQPELAEYLREKGFNDEEIEAACQAASGDQDMAADDPTDLAHGGEPRVGGA